MAVDTNATKATAQTQHPVYKAMLLQWKKWRLAYEGGEPFKEEYVFPYSKRENLEDFKSRRRLTYVPGHSKAVINIIRNAIAIRLPDVQRQGSEQFLEAMSTNVDGFNNNINTFVGLDVTPMLLVQGKRYVVVDAPQAEEGKTLAEDAGLPYYFALGAEDVLSWSYDANGSIRSILIRLIEDVEDPQTRLIKGAKEVFRLMVRLESGESYSDSECGELVGPGVLVKTFDKDGKNTVPCNIMDWVRVPVAEFRLVDSIMKEIVDHQIALLNLTSTDMDFLWRGNFPLYTQQQPKGRGTIRPRGSKGLPTSDPLDTDSEMTVDGTPDQKKDQTRSTQGIGKGVGYAEGMERPDFISPKTDNLSASMNKQQAIITEIRVLVDLALVSLSVKALEQSGKSKEADRVGEEAGLSYIGRSLEGGERDLAELWHMMAGLENVEIDIRYPSGYSVKTQDERLEEADSMRKLRSAVRSEQYQKMMDKRIAEIILKPVSTAEELAAIMKEITSASYFDDDKERAAVVQKDVALKILSKASGAAMRGYDESEIAKVEAETVAGVNALASAAGALGGGFPNQGTEDDEEEDDEGGEGDEE